MYLDISLELRNIFDLSSIVEGNFPKRKWIMGVCDLNYWLVCADMCLYLSATFEFTNKCVFVPTIT